MLYKGNVQKELIITAQVKIKAIYILNTNVLFVRKIASLIDFWVILIYLPLWTKKN